MPRPTPGQQVSALGLGWDPAAVLHARASYCSPLSLPRSPVAHRSPPSSFSPPLLCLPLRHEVDAKDKANGIQDSRQWQRRGRVGGAGDAGAPLRLLPRVRRRRRLREGRRCYPGRHRHTAAAASNDIVIGPSREFEVHYKL